MKYVNVDEVLKILHKYGEHVFVNDMKRYQDMTDEIANLKGLKLEDILGGDINNKVYCDRNICLQNEYNGIGCKECIVNKETSDGERD